MAYFPPTIINRTDNSVFYLGANKESNGTYVSIGLLNKITTPTKSNINIYYEPHTYYSEIRQADKTVGGARVLQITYTDRTNKVLNVKHFNYTSTDSKSSGVLQDEKFYFRYTKSNNDDNPNTTCTAHVSGYDRKCLAGYVISSTSLIYYSPYSTGQVVNYSKVTESLVGKGQISYEFNNIPVFYNFFYKYYQEDPANYSCPKPFDYQGTAATQFYNMGDHLNYYTKKVLQNYYPTVSSVNNTGVIIGFGQNVVLNGTTTRDQLFYSYYIKNGLAKTVTTYRENGTAAEKTDYQYGTKVSLDIDATQIKSTVEYLPLLVDQYSYHECSYALNCLFMISTPRINTFLLSQTETIYAQSNNAPIVNTTNYRYDSPYHNYSTRVYHTKNDQQVTGMMYLYPLDYKIVSPTPAQIIPEQNGIIYMQVQNIACMPVEQVSFIANTSQADNVSAYNVTYAKVNSYLANHVSGNIVTVTPSNIKTYYLNNVPINTYTFSNQIFSGSSYFLGASNELFQNHDSNYPDKNIETITVANNNGMILQSNKIGDIPQSILLDNNKYPIAQVLGAPYNQIAYTSFEGPDYTTGWSISASGSSSIPAYTGKYYYQTTASISLTNTSPPAGTYRLSFVAQSSQPGQVVIILPNLQMLPITQSSNWIYYEVILTNPNGLMIAPGSSSVAIDELRLCPVDAKMVTKSYKPLVGVITETDENCIPTYYEYEGLNRIKNIRDQDRNIIKHYDYHLGN